MIDKAILELSGETISISLRDSYQMVSNEHLCCGLIFDPYAHSLNTKLNNEKISINYNNVVYIPKEFIVSKEWLRTKRLDWNNSLSKIESEYECIIDIDGTFDVTKLQYNCIYPIIVRVGDQTYKFNQPVLVDIVYNGCRFSISPKIKPIKPFALR